MVILLSLHATFLAKLCRMLAVHLAIFSGVIAYYLSCVSCVLFHCMDAHCSMSLQGVQKKKKKCMYVIVGEIF